MWSSSTTWHRDLPPILSVGLLVVTVFLPKITFSISHRKEENIITRALKLGWKDNRLKEFLMSSLCVLSWNTFF